MQDLEAENLSSLKKLESAEVLSLKEEVKELEAQVLDKTKVVTPCILGESSLHWR